MTRLFSNQIPKLGACSRACNWVGELSLEDAWVKCDRGDWLAWFIARINIDPKLVIATMCACARESLLLSPVQIVPAREVVEAAELCASDTNNAARLSELSDSVATLSRVYMESYEQWHPGNSFVASSVIEAARVALEIHNNRCSYGAPHHAGNAVVQGSSAATFFYCGLGPGVDGVSEKLSAEFKLKCATVIRTMVPFVTVRNAFDETIAAYTKTCG